jgi:hypothetical protein
MAKSTCTLIVLWCSLTASAEIQKNGDGMVENDKSPTEMWTVVKFRGQKEGSAGMAFPNTSRVMPVDLILSEGTYFKNLKEFQEKMKNRPGLKLFIVDERVFKSEGIDSTIFQGFEGKIIDAK